jgi:hypothetical protein
MTSMKKILAVGLATLLVGGTATAALAAPHHSYGHSNYGGYYRHDRGGNVAGAAVAAGILGLAIGAIASSQSHDYYYAPSFAAPPPPPVYGYGVYRAPVYPYAAPAYGYAGTGVNLGFRF